MACTLAAIQEAACASGIAKEQSKIKLLQLIAQLTCEASEGGGGGGSAVWGEITGTLSNQTDLQSALDAAAGTAVWGTITGTLSNQTDLQNALDAKVDVAGDTMTGLLTIAQATANTSALAVTGYSLTGANAQSLLSLAGTWNTSGTPTALDLTITNTASNAASRLFNFGTSVSPSLLSLTVGGVLQFLGGGVSGQLSSSGGFLLYSSSPASAILAGVDGVARAVIGVSGVQFVSGGVVNWSSNVSGPASASVDLVLLRDAANILAQRNGVNAQTFRWYRTWTDASNYERGALQTAAGQVIVAAETAGTGTDDIDLTLTPAGAGNVRFGTHAGLAGESVTGFITIKDAAGNARKIAVVS